METDKKSKKKKFLLIGFGLAGAGLLSFFGWEYYQDKKKRKEDGSDDNSSPQEKIPSAPQKSAFMPDFYSQSKSRNDDFPLKKGSRGAKVKEVQDALVVRYGKSILPRYGADGDFGNEMASALKKLNLPDTIDESNFNVIVKAAGINASELARSLYKDASNQNIDGVIATLKKMRSKNDYSAVSEDFKKYSLRGVSQTLVNGLLGSFSDEDARQQIRLEFTRMGLKYDGSKWSLSGVDGFKVITKEATTIWRTPTEGAKVPASMVLGTEVAERNGYTLFENAGRKFIVKTSAIKYL